MTYMIAASHNKRSRSLLSASTPSAMTAAASVQTYNFPCYGSRVGTSYPALSSTDAWIGSFSSATPESYVNGNVNQSPFECAPLGFGLTPDDTRIAPILESEQSIRQLQQQWVTQGATDLSVELWFSPPAETMEQAAPIFTIGQTAQDASAVTGVVQYGSCEGYDVRISQLDTSRLEVSFRDDGPFRACRTLSVDIPPPNPLLDDSPLTQLIVVLGKQGLSVYVNGQTIHEKARIDFLGTLENWNPRYHMQLMSNHLLGDMPDADFYPGSIHQLSLYNSAVESQSASALYLGGLQAILDAAKPKTAPPLPAPTPAPITNPAPITQDSHPPTPSPVSNTIPPISNVPGIPVLVATPNGMYSMPQGQTTSFHMKLQGLSSISPNDADGWWTLKMEVLSVTQFGILSLVDNSQKTTITAGELLDMKVSDEIDTDDIPGAPVPIPELRISVDYTLQATDYFNAPRVSSTGEDLSVIPESFEYRILAIDNLTNDVLASSGTVRQAVHVRHVNQPSKLVTAMERHMDWSDEPYYSMFGNRPLAQFSDRIVLQNPDDRKIDRVRVDVFATNGTLTLNEEHRHLAEFESCRDRDYSSWQCTGNGKDNQIMTFLAYPSDVELIFQDMEYKGYYNEPDEIVLRVFDGVGGDCLSQAEHAAFVDEDGHRFSSIYDGQCRPAQLMFDLDPLDGSSVPTVEAGKHFPALVGFLLVFIGLICCCGCCISYCACNRRKAGTGIEIHPEDEPTVECCDSDFVADDQEKEEDTDSEDTVCDAV